MEVASAAQIPADRADIQHSIGIIDAISHLRPGDVVRRQEPEPGPDLVSVIIPMWNARGWIDTCVTSILAQTHANLEVFCVDDCSGDDSYERVVSQFGADRRLGVFRLRHRVGPYQIKNWAIATWVRGRYVAMQDADDLSHPTRIAVQVRWMKKYGLRVSGTHVHQFSPDGTRLLWGTQPVILRHDQLHNLVAYPPVQAPRSDDYRQFFGERRFALAMHGSQMYERAVLREFGGFDGQTVIGADTDLNWRLLRFMDLGSVPRVLYSRRIHAASLTRHPATGYDSATRQSQRERYDMQQEKVARTLRSGDLERGKALCTRDLYHGDVEVEDAHLGVHGGRRPATGGAR